MHRHQGPGAGGNLWLLLPRTRLRCTRNQTASQLLLSHGGRSRCCPSHRDPQHGKRRGHPQPRRRPLQNHLFSFAREDALGVTVADAPAQDQTGGTFPLPQTQFLHPLFPVTQELPATASAAGYTKRRLLPLGKQNSSYSCALSVIEAASHSTVSPSSDVASAGSSVRPGCEERRLLGGFHQHISPCCRVTQAELRASQTGTQRQEVTPGSCNDR